METLNKTVQGETSYASRFGLSTLFYVTAVIAAAVALLGVGGIFWAVLVFVFWFFQPQILLSKTKILVLIFVTVILIGMMLPAAHHAPIRLIHANQAKEICLAILNYEAANGHFPPAYIADENGTPMHSWRVLILPYMELQALYDQYDFDEPWNGPNNSKLADKMPRSTIFDPYANTSERSTSTGFKLVTGPETAFVENQTKSRSDITAGLSNVIMLVDDPAKPVNWMSPVDVNLEQATELFDRKNAKPSLVSENQFKITRRYIQNVGMFDASVYRAGYLEDASEMRKHFTIKTAPDTRLYDVDFEYRSYEHESKPGGYILVAINFSLAVLPVFWTRKAP